MARLFRDARRDGRRSEVTMGTKDKGGSKASKKPAQKDIKQKREAKRSKKGK